MKRIIKELFAKLTKNDGRQIELITQLIVCYWYVAEKVTGVRPVKDFLRGGCKVALSNSAVEAIVRRLKTNNPKKVEDISGVNIPENAEKSDPESWIQPWLSAQLIAMVMAAYEADRQPRQPAAAGGADDGAGDSAADGAAGGAADDGAAITLADLNLEELIELKATLLRQVAEIDRLIAKKQ